MGSYDEMLVRLEKYRKSIPMKQKQMGAGYRCQSGTIFIP